MALGTVSCDKYDLDERDPEGWGASIYSFLNDAGNYTITTRLIQDLDLAETLSKTGSKTLFASSDESYAEFFKKNKWQVSSYEQLSKAQKKLLLNGSMIDNPYQVADLSSTQNRTEGMCMRRNSSISYLDSVAVVPQAELPNMDAADWKYNTFWKRFANRDKVVLLKDATTAPMIHFIEDFMVNNKITNEDYEFLFGDKPGTRQAGDAAVNGVKIRREGQNQRCSNGFVHEMEGVIMPLSNMAEVIATTPELSQYSKLLDRFSFPHYAGKTVTDQYNALYKANVDSVFEKRYFSLKSHPDPNKAEDNGKKSVQITADDFGVRFAGDPNVHPDDYLTFDPGWNTYFTGDATSTADERMKNDMAVMVVPSNTAMDNFMSTEREGIALSKEYPEGFKDVPNSIVALILNNNQLQSFVKSVPSKFDNVLNSNNDPMKLSKDQIERVIFANNGVIYVTKKLYAPTNFITVLNPVTFDSNLAIMKWAIQRNEYNVYLNSLESTYSLILHTNGSLKYIDPLSVLQNTRDNWKVYEFKYDPSRTNQGKDEIYAKIWQYDADTHEMTEIPGDEGIEENADQLKWRLREILDACIVVHDEGGGLSDDVPYYRTMGYQTIKVKNPSKAEAGGMTVATSRLINEGNNSAITIVNPNEHDNGKTYQIDTDEPLQATFKSVLDMMKETVDETGEMAEFYNLINGNLDEYTEDVRDKKQYAFTRNIKSFNTFHYTVYVPTNESVDKWLKQNNIYNHEDPTIKGWDYVFSLEEGSPERVADSIKLGNFVKYHFQDNALFIGAQPEAGEFTTGYVITEDLGEGIKRSKFKKLRAELTKTGVTVQDYEKKGPVRKVLTTNSKCYNIMAREYFFDLLDYNTGRKASSPEECNRLYGASSAVLHLIDGPLETDFSK